MSETVYRHGHFVWRELMTTDLGKAKAFYQGLFGWKLTDMPMSDGNYTIINNGEAQIGGMMSVPEGAPPVSFWHSYVSVANVDEAMEKAKSGGGQALVGPVEAPGVGRFAILMDPQGGVFSVIRQASGDGEMARPPVGAFCWESLNPTDANALVPFYEHTIGWHPQSTPMGGALHAGDQMVADVGAAPPGMPTHWITHVAVEKLEAVRDKVTGLGGKVVMPEIPVPSYGRLAIVADPAGAFISIFEPAPH